MIRVLTIVLLAGVLQPAFATSKPADCGDAVQPLSLRRHMLCMSYDMDEVFVNLGRLGAAPTASDHLREVRRHAQQSLAMTPSRIKTLKPAEARLKTLEFQIHLAEVYLTIARLEHRLLTRPNLGDSPASDPLTAQLALRLQQLIGEGHQRFR